MQSAAGCRVLRRPLTGGSGIAKDKYYSCFAAA